jgi:hypothetical protein
MAIPKLTTDKFQFEYDLTDAGLHIKVVRETDKAEKVFFIAGMKGGSPKTGKCPKVTSLL